ncbi:O-antigen ligase [Parafrankia sp. BMG5.11]|uniref:O-antigen ligase family protein n=1 Tax=Parafrankia sp. BMG5.11 TaxID=222540 RepID=UPI001038F14C|nr:O-antigen ligase family protein [Parafrankia sp. BMG5.11]TCJ32807.1 O-antigen ligase family protein [Parafrankia sp. BMG5.11]
MRFLALLLILVAVPAFLFMLRSKRGYRTACFLLGILPFCLNALNLDFAIVNWAAWPGYAKGLVVTILDSLSLAFIIANRNVLSRLPFKVVFIAYFLAMSLSAFGSSTPMAAAFYPFQLLRIFALFLAVALLMGRPEGLRWLVAGLGSAAILQGLVTLTQRLDGVFQAPGTMAHQNMLGLMLHFVILPLFAVVLAGRPSKLVLAGVLLGLLAVALGASRATIGFLGMGLVLLIGLSLWRSTSQRKWKAVGAGVLAMILAAPLALSGLEQRSESQNLEGSYHERLAFERAAKLMLADNPMGVGANQYVVTANLGGYSERAGVIWNAGSRAAHVHNLYLLTAAEGGWLGLLALVALFAWPIIRGLEFGLRKVRDWRGDIVLGATVALIVAAAHSLYEWIFVSYQAQYLFAIALGLIAGSIRQQAREQRAAKRRFRVLGPLHVGKACRAAD